MPGEGATDQEAKKRPSKSVTDKFEIDTFNYKHDIFQIYK